MSSIARICSVPLSARHIQAAKRGIPGVRAALEAPMVPKTAEEMLAEREQWRQECEVAAHRQGALKLRGGH